MNPSSKCPICGHLERDHFGLIAGGDSSDLCAVEDCDCERPW